MSGMAGGMNKKNGMRYRTKLIVFFLFSAAITMMACIYTYVSSQLLIRETSQMFSKNLELAAVYSELGDIQQDIQIYLSTNSSESLLSYYDRVNTISYNANRMMENASYTARGIKTMNISNMITHYLKQTDGAMVAKRGRNINDYTEYYAQTVKENAYIMSYIQEIMSRDLIDSLKKSAEINQKVQSATIFNIILILGVVAFVSAAIVAFSFEITRPITQLAKYSKEISDGNFDVEIKPIKASGEISVLYGVFNLMAVNIREHFNQMQEKQRLEKSLSEQKLNNLKIKNALRESELLALQSQVNPHFIFNTINIGAKIAMMQGDKITCTYLENAADIFRYNLKGLDTRATLKDEIENVVSYMYLLQTRFGDSVDFTVNIDGDESLLATELPRMTLQPLAENAYIHGISEQEDGGRITLTVSGGNELVTVTVADNGKGLTQEKIKELLVEHESDAEPRVKPPKAGHTTGIGVDNVLKRLRLFFGRSDVMDIRRENGETKFILMLPRGIKPGLDDEIE